VPELHARFRRERKVLARLHQTHTVPIYAAGQAKCGPYFAMAYIRGAALHHALDQARRGTTLQRGAQTPTLAELARAVTRAPRPYKSAAAAPTAKRLHLPAEYYRSVAAVLVEAAEALHHAHQARIVHRDVKPSNLMVDRAGNCWLIDYGLAGYVRQREEAPASSVPVPTAGQSALTRGLVGTPQYLAPERFEPGAEKQPDVRWDVWGLGGLCPTTSEGGNLGKAGSYPASLACQFRRLLGKAVWERPSTSC
jgi:eukaryotic-like serine/threonine-protein kinase